MIDLLEHHRLNKENKIECLDHGFVRLVDVMPRVVEDDDIPTGDHAIVRAARVSYGKGTKTVNEDRGLIRYLMRHLHTTPFEMVEVSFHCKMPIFVARQWIRHRTASVNEYSGRYSIMSPDFYVPEIERIQNQSKTNNQGTAEDGSLSLSTQIIIQNKMIAEQQSAQDHYENYISADVARELARNNLPVSNYTEWYWKIDLKNLFHFLSLRLDSHAQYEIRVFAEAIYEFIKPMFPFACEAFEDYQLQGCRISKAEKGIISSLLNQDSDIINDYLENDKTLSKREKDEFKKKFGI